MKKSDLKTGMIVTLRNWNEYVVFIDAQNTNMYDSGSVIVNASKFLWQRLKDFNEDMTNIREKKWDIMKVELASHPYCYMNLNNGRENRKLLWEREEVKEMTMEELEKHFGCKVKIIKGNE